MGTYGDLVWMDGFDGYSENSILPSEIYVLGGGTIMVARAANSRWQPAGKAAVNSNNRGIGWFSKRLFPQNNPTNYLYAAGAGWIANTSTLDAIQFTSGQTLDTSDRPAFNFLYNTVSISFNGGAFTNYSLSPTLTQNAWHFFEVKAFCHPTTGWVKVRIDGQTRVEVGNINVGNGRLWDSVLYYINGSETAGGGNLAWDDIFIYTNTPSGLWLGDCRVMKILATGNGIIDNFTGTPSGYPNTYSNITGDGVDGKYNYSQSSGATDLFFYQLPPTLSGIYGVKINTLATKTNSDSINITPVFSGTGIHTGNSSPVIFGSYSYNTHILGTSPETNFDWTVQELSGFQFGYRRT